MVVKLASARLHSHSQEGNSESSSHFSDIERNVVVHHRWFLSFAARHLREICHIVAGVEFYLVQFKFVSSRQNVLSFKSARHSRYAVVAVDARGLFI